MVLLGLRHSGRSLTSAAKAGAVRAPMMVRATRNELVMSRRCAKFDLPRGENESIPEVGVVNGFVCLQPLRFSWISTTGG
jgi:hypothetical protein